MSIKLMSIAWGLKIPLAPKMVLLALADHANDDGTCYPSQERLSMRCAQTARSVANSVKWLVEHGFLDKTRRSKGWGRDSNLYKIKLQKTESQSAESQSAEYAPEESQSEDCDNLKVNITTSQSAEYALTYRDEPSLNHQYNHSSSSIQSTHLREMPPPPIAPPSGQVQRIGYVCRLLRSKGVLHVAPGQFRGKYQGLEQHSDDDFYLAVQTLQDRGEQRIGIGLVAAVLGDMAHARSNPTRPRGVTAQREMARQVSCDTLGVGSQYEQPGVTYAQLTH